MDPDVAKIIFYIVLYAIIDIIFNLCEYKIKKRKANKENTK